MTTAHDGSGSDPARDAAAGMPGAPGRPYADPEDVDVLALAGRRPARQAHWLLVTEADGLPGSVFSAYVLPADGRQGRGGDVLVRLAPTARSGPGPETIDVSVWAIIGGRLVPVAAWIRLDLDGWPERIRQTAAFAMGMVTELEEHGADLHGRDRVDLDAAAATELPGVPRRLTPGPPPAPPGR